LDWLGRPAARGWALVVGVLLLVAPLWLWTDPLDGYSARREGPRGLLERLEHLVDPFTNAQLTLDDFAHVAESRTMAELQQHLLLPHNAHLVPLLRLWTFLWVRLAGTLERLPMMLAVASYLTYVLAMLLVGHVVAWESGRSALGLAAMAAFGISAVLEPSVRWFGASVSLLAGATAVAALAALQRWRGRKGWWWLALATVATAVAPWFWSGGYVAGASGFAYLWADGRSRARKAAWLPLAASAASALTSFAVAGRAIVAASHFSDRTPAQAFKALQGTLSTAQAIAEVLVLRNLGLEAVTAPYQALVLVLMLAAIWAWSRGRPFRLNALEAAGGTLAVLGFLLAYTARGYFEFDNLRDLHWYRAIPQLGAVLFAAGWWMGRAQPGEPPPRALVRPTRGGLLAVLGIGLIANTLQRPIIHAEFLTRVYPLSASEQVWYPVPPLQRLRARYLIAEEAAWQRRSLARLDRAEESARRASIGRAVIRRSIGRVLVPGMPAEIAGLDGVNLLSLPEEGTQRDPDRIRSLLVPLLTPEPEPRPPWLEPREPWPPQSRSSR
jgi:hypothetical protein